MGLGGISIWQLLIVLAIILLIFGPKRIRSLGSELGGALKGFKKEMKEEEGADPKQLGDDQQDSTFEEVKETKEKEEQK